MKFKIVFVIAFAFVSQTLASQTKVVGCGNTEVKDGRITVDVVKDMKTGKYVKLLVDLHQGKGDQEYTIVSEDSGKGDQVILMGQDLNIPKTAGFDHYTLKYDTSKGLRKMEATLLHLTQLSQGKPDMIKMSCGIVNPR